MELLSRLERFLWPVWFDAVAFTINPGDGTGAANVSLPDDWYYCLQGNRIGEPRHALKDLQDAINNAMIAQGSTKRYSLGLTTATVHSTSTIKRANVLITRTAGGTQLTTISNMTAGFREMIGYAVTGTTISMITTFTCTNVPLGVWSSPVAPHDRRSRPVRQAFSSSAGPAHYANAWPGMRRRDYAFRFLHPAVVRATPSANPVNATVNSSTVPWGGKAYFNSPNPGFRQGNVLERLWVDANAGPHPMIALRADADGLYPADGTLTGTDWDEVRLLPESITEWEAQTDDVGSLERYDVGFSVEVIPREVAP